MTLTYLIVLMIFIQFKHLIVDWLWQPPYEWQNKGTYGHMGGIVHSMKNAIGTAICFIPFFGIIPSLMVLMIDFICHYHIDWAKMNINKKMGWTATTHNEFWMLTGTDQFLHQLTYLLLILIML